MCSDVVSSISSLNGHNKHLKTSIINDYDGTLKITSFRDPKCITVNDVHALTDLYICRAMKHFSFKYSKIFTSEDKLKNIYFEM